MIRVAVVALLLLSGCSANQLRDNISDATGVTAGVVATAVTGNPLVGAAVGGGTSVAVNTVTQPEVVDIAQVTNVHQEEVAEAQIQADLIESLGTKGILGVIGGFIIYTLLTWFIGRITPRRSEIRLQERERMAKEQRL